MRKGVSKHLSNEASGWRRRRKAKCDAREVFLSE
jgi:hypothetical protein